MRTLSALCRALMDLQRNSRQRQASYKVIHWLLFFLSLSLTMFLGKRWILKLSPQEVKPPKQLKLIEVLGVSTIINNNNVLMVQIYRTPRAIGANYFYRLEEELNSVCTWATMKCSTVIIIGDLNLDRLKPEEIEGRTLLNLEEVFGFKCLITEPTRVTPTSESLLDVILTNKPELFKASGVFNPELSDHHFIYGLMKDKVFQHDRKILTFRSTKNMDTNKFNEDLSVAPWDVMETFDTLDDKYKYWESMFNSIVEKHMPIKRMRFRKKDVPYMTKEWKRAIGKKIKYAKQFAHRRTEENWELKRKWRNESTKCRRRAIREYWKMKADDLKSKPGDFYKTFTPFLSDKNKSKEKIEVNVKRNGHIQKEQNKVADILANYFSTIANNIGPEGVNELTEDDTLHHPSVKTIESNNADRLGFCFQPLTSERVKSALDKLKVNKASGYDQISPKILKLGSKGITDSLTKIYNESIYKGEWPAAWKKGEWNPIYKKGDRLDETNYRPITLLSTVDKVYEQLLSNQVKEYFDQILDPCLTAYRKRHSCETTLLKLTEEWKLALDLNKYAGVLSTDMSKAFDSLHPALMINKLKAYGFSENSISLMRSYLTNRQNRVKLDTVVSDWKETVRGCPQGSSLGPLLWNIFQNDMTYVVTNNNTSLSMYADDHQVSVSANSVGEVETSINKEGNSMSAWYKENYLKGNYEKYNAMIIGRKKDMDSASLNVEIDEKNIKSSSTMKLLGVTLTNDFNYSIHISNICKKASSKISVLGRMRHMVTTEAKLQLYKSAILPDITYCHTVWHFCKASDTRKLEKIQERALRIVFNNTKSATYEELLERANLPTLTNRRLQDILILMYKVKQSLAPSYINDLFHNHEKKYNLRNSDFYTPRFNTVTYGKHSIRYLGPYMWGKINQELRNKPTLQSFKKSVRRINVSNLLDNTCNCIACIS